CETVRALLHRTASFAGDGTPWTLGEKMSREGAVLAAAGCTEPTLDADDLDYSRTVIESFLDTTDMPTAVACLCGDAAARTLGFAPLGLSPSAGLAVALHAARRLRPYPEGVE